MIEQEFGPKDDEPYLKGWIPVITEEHTEALYSFYCALGAFLEEADRADSEVSPTVSEFQVLLRNQMPKGVQIEDVFEFTEIKNEDDFARFLLTPAIEGKDDTKPCHLISAFFADDEGAGFCKIMEGEWWEPVLDVDHQFRVIHTKMSFHAEELCRTAAMLAPIATSFKKARSIALLEQYHNKFKDTEYFKNAKGITEGEPETPAINRPGLSEFSQVMDHLGGKQGAELDDLKGERTSIVLPYGDKEIWDMETFVPRLNAAFKSYVENAYHVNPRVSLDGHQPW